VTKKKIIFIIGKNKSKKGKKYNFKRFLKKLSLYLASQILKWRIKKNTVRKKAGKAENISSE